MDARGSHELTPGASLGGKYQILRRLAVGGMAELYLARTRGMGGFEKLVVIKRVLPHLAEEPEFIEMFFREARLAATLDHPNIVHVMDIGALDEDPYFVMEYVHGEDLRAVLRKAAPRGSLGLEQAVAIVDAAATGLHYVHERNGLDGRPLGLVHRDVSPSNILVTYDGGVKVADFGIVKAAARTQMTRAGMMKGKVGYMSPEQCRGDEVDRRSDVFALGILLYETTTGHRLFHGDNDYAVLHRIVSGKYMPLSFDVQEYPESLKAIVSRALRRDVDERYPTAEALSIDLQSFAQEAGLRLSSQIVAGCVRDLFGERPYPSTDDRGLVAVSSTASGPSEEPTPERSAHALGMASVHVPSSARRAWITMAVVSSLAISFGVAGFVRGRAPAPAPAPAPAASADVPESLDAREEPALEKTPVVREAAMTSTRADDSSGEMDIESSVATTSVDPRPSSEDLAEDLAEPATPRKKPVRRRVRRPTKTPDRSGQVDDLFPPSHDKQP
jgi:serine/threonine protein kinase